MTIPDVRDPVLTAMCNGATPEEAREVMEALDVAFDALVHRVQYNPHDKALAQRLETVRAILRRMERAAAGLT